MRKPALLLSLAVLVIHALANPHYGFFRDELYFIICGRHPQWGYVDQPPIVPLLSAASQLFGNSLFMLRLVPALFAAGGTYVTCLLVAEFGGGIFAEVVAATTFFFTPVLMSFATKVGTDEVGLLTWPLIALLVVRVTRGADPRLWLWIGALVGISLEGKYSVIFFAAALALGLVLTPQRRIFFSRWALLGSLVALLIALPNLAWQLHYGLPMLELLRAGQDGKNLILSPPLYLVQELLTTNPLLAIEWIIGLVFLLRVERFRFLGVAYVALIFEMIVLHGKHYYPANVYPILIAAGAIWIEHWTTLRAPRRVAAIAYVLLVGSIAVPDVLPILSESQDIAFVTERAHITHLSKAATNTENGRENSAMIADFADMHGWPEMAAAAKRAYESLSPRERVRAVVFAGNYGEASAVAFFTPEIPVISEHNQFWLWGPGAYTGSILVQINGTCFKDQKLFASRTRFATVHSPYALTFENDIPIWICRNPRQSLAQIWPTLKNYE